MKYDKSPCQCLVDVGIIGLNYAFEVFLSEPGGRNCAADYLLRNLVLLKTRMIPSDAPLTPFRNAQTHWASLWEYVRRRSSSLLGRVWLFYGTLHKLRYFVTGLKQEALTSSTRDCQTLSCVTAMTEFGDWNG